MTYFSQYGFSSADVAGAVAEAAIHDLRVNGFSFNGFPQILISTDAERLVFKVTLSWTEHGDCTSAFELSLSEAKAVIKRFKSKQGYDPHILDRIQTCLASLEGKAGHAHRQATMGTV